jgi:hypothetical protein
MAIAPTQKDQFIEAITEYLRTAEICLHTRKPDGGLLGYSATLLLLCVTDAIGHRLTTEGGHTRLKVLNCPDFGLALTEPQIKDLTQRYRNPLAHNGLIDPHVALSADTVGEPFEFEAGKLKTIRVPVFYDLVLRVWARLVDKDALGEFREDKKRAAQGQRRVTSLVHPGSGLA